jgi:hypothetical protein
LTTRSDSTSSAGGVTPSDAGLSPKRWKLTARRAAIRPGPLPEYGVIEDQHDHRTNYGNEDAVDANTVNAGRTHRGENPSADECSDDSENDVANQPFAGLVNKLAADEARD